MPNNNISFRGILQERNEGFAFLDLVGADIIRHIADGSKSGALYAPLRCLIFVKVKGAVSRALYYHKLNLNFCLQSPVCPSNLQCYVLDLQHVFHVLYRIYDGFRHFIVHRHHSQGHFFLFISAEGE